MFRGLLLAVFALVLFGCNAACQWRETDWQPNIAPLAADDVRTRTCAALLASPGSGFYHPDVYSCEVPGVCQLISITHAPTQFLTKSGPLAYYVDDTREVSPPDPVIVEDVPCDLDTCEKLALWLIGNQPGSTLVHD
jgi:hypothetical protein